MEIQSKKDFLVNLAFFCVTMFIVILTIRFAFSYLFPFLIGVIIAYIMQKPAVWISNRVKISKGISAAILSVITYILVLGIFTLIIWAFISNISKIMNLFSAIADDLLESFEKIKTFFISYFDMYFKKINLDYQGLFSNAAFGLGEKLTTFISSAITKFLKNLPSFFISCIVTVVATCYIAKEFDILKKFVRNMLSKQLNDNLSVIKEIFINCVLKFLIGYLLLMGITFAELLVGLSVLGIKNVFVVSLVISLVDLLPILGTGTVLLPWSVALFLQENYAMGIGIVLLYVIICVVRNVLEPKIIGKQMGFNPLLTLISMFLGLRLAGIAGLVLLPIAVIITITFYKRQMNEESVID